MSFRGCPLVLLLRSPKLHDFSTADEYGLRHVLAVSDIK
jgi:hypothetical protein